eukprot:357713-Chlamydomonas_euryale.AAC.16
MAQLGRDMAPSHQLGERLPAPARPGCMPDMLAAASLPAPACVPQCGEAMASTLALAPPCAPHGCVAADRRPLDTAAWSLGAPAAGTQPQSPSAARHPSCTPGVPNTPSPDSPPNTAAMRPGGSRQVCATPGPLALPPPLVWRALLAVAAPVKGSSARCCAAPAAATAAGVQLPGARSSAAQPAAGAATPRCGAHRPRSMRRTGSALATTELAHTILGAGRAFGGQSGPLQRCCRGAKSLPARRLPQVCQVALGVLRGTCTRRGTSWLQRMVHSCRHAMWQCGMEGGPKRERPEGRQPGWGGQRASGNSRGAHERDLGELRGGRGGGGVIVQCLPHGLSRQSCREWPPQPQFHPATWSRMALIAKDPFPKKGQHWLGIGTLEFKSGF